MVRSPHTYSKKSLLLLALLCILILLGTSLWVALKHGIEVNRIQLSSMSVERIHVRVDGGIITSIDRLDILENHDIDSLLNPEILLSWFNASAHLFREIQVKQIHYREMTFDLLFKDNRFTASGDNFQLAGTLAYQDGSIRLEIEKLAVTPYPLILKGNAVYIRKKHQLDFSGSFSSQLLSGQLTVSQHQNKVDAEISTGPFTDLPGLLEHFPLDKELTAWISENITARDYRIDQFHLGLILLDGKPDIRPDSIYGTAVATDAAILFHPSLSPVQSRQIHISLADDRLSFNLDEPVYKTKNLAGSNVSVDHLLAGPSQMTISIQTETRLDREVHALLRTYDVDIPFTQQTGSTRAHLNLIFALPDFTVRANGSFSTDEGDWTSKDTPFHTSGAAVQLKDGLILVDSAEIAYQDMLRANVMGTVDPRTQKGTLTTRIHDLNLRDGEKNILKARNLLTPINLQFSNEDVNISLFMLQANIAISPSRRLCVLDNLNKVKSFIPFIDDFPFQDGRVEIDFTDPDNLAFEGSIDTSALPLSENNQPVTHFTFQGRKSADQLTAEINKGKISLTVTDTVDIDLNDYLLAVDTGKFGRKAGQASPVPISISGPRSLIRIKDISLPTGLFQAELNGQSVSFSAELEQGKILFESNGTDMTLTASEIDAQIAQDFFPFTDLEGGRFNLLLKGQDENNFEGFVEFSNVLIKDLALLNNVLSFMNAIPALATLSSPGFDANGYQVSQGVAQFARNNNLLTIEQLRTDGTTINTEADGWVDLETDNLKINLELISLKDYSKIISKIPWAGYAILGENGSLSTSLLLSGKRLAPDITTNLTEEIVMMPINFVKRTIQWPFRVLGRIKDLATDKPAPEK